MIFFGDKKNNATGGFLDVDNRRGGNGSAENIYWENPPRGEYEIYVKYYQAAHNPPQYGQCQVVIFNGNNTPQTYNLTMDRIGRKRDVTTIRL